MDTDDFLEELIGYYEDYPLSEYITDRAIRRAESEIGVSLSAVTEGSDQRIWFDNRVEYHILGALLSTSAADFDYSKAKLSQVFDQYRLLRKDLKDDWDTSLLPAMKVSDMQSRPSNLFQPIDSGRRYTGLGKALN